MAGKDVQLDQETISCSICLDLLKEPVTIPCGHSYCMNCIKTHWDGEDQRGTHSCPQCRKTFNPRPVLMKNTMLAFLVEELKKTGLKSAPDDLCYAGPEDVGCDVCTGRKVKAVQSCLVCLASYCEKHLQPHYHAPPLKKHKLVDPVSGEYLLQENICSLHDEVMKFFCSTDQKRICYLCSMHEHRGHVTAPVLAERSEKEKELEVSRRQIQQRIQDREKDVELLQQEVEDINVSADKAVEDSEKSFNEVVRLLQKRSSDVKQQVRFQQEHEVSRVKDLQEKLQQEITDLKRIDAELGLTNTENHHQFLHNDPSPSSTSIQTRPLRYFEDVTAAVSETKKRILDLLRETWTKISLSVAEVDVLLPGPEPKTRAGFLNHSRDITLDPNTTNTHLLLSNGNRKVTVMREKQSHPSHPDRFMSWWQVLSLQSLTERCYFEMEWKGDGICIAVAYKDISRAGNSDDCRFGSNDKSWALRCDRNKYSFWYNNVDTPVSGPPSSRFGVYVDHRAGVLSFYSVSKTLTLLHRVQTSFTQPLCVGVRLTYYGVTAKFIKLK